MDIKLYPDYFIRSLFIRGKKSFFSAGYKCLHPECVKNGMTPWQHYVIFGQSKGYSDGNAPSDSVFFSEGYELEYPDVKQTGLNSWRHYAEYGHDEGRDNGLHPDEKLFFPEGYLEMYPDVARAKADPWKHYVLHGKDEGRDNGLHPDEKQFFPEGYLIMYPDVARAKADPWKHYVLHGKDEGRDNGLHPDVNMFFPAGYLLMYLGVARTKTDPWKHYVLHGIKEGRDNGLHPNEKHFFSEGYLIMYPDVAKTKTDPWIDYVQQGKKEGRDNGLHPSSEQFSAKDYLRMYPDVANAKVDPWKHYVLNGIKEGRDNGLHRKKISFVQLTKNIQNITAGSFASVNVKVDNSRPKSINIVMPAIAKHTSAGPLSILYFGRFLINNKYHVRLLINSDEEPESVKDILKYQNDDISKISDSFEVATLPLNKCPEVLVNEQDMTVATLFNTATAARLIQSKCRNKKFIYFIQDDEREFFPASSLRCAVEQSYAYDCYPIFSTEILARHFINEDIGKFKTKKVKVMWQGCPANYYLPSFDKFANRNKKKFVFYARPNNPRNCYAFAMYLIIQAINENLFDESWEFYGIGYPEVCDFELPKNRILHMLPNMSLDEYKDSLSTYDVALSLMATPHTSMPPIDLSLSGCIVVTNTYKNKTEKVLKDISNNIVSAPLLVAPLVEAIRKAIILSNNLELRYKNAMKAKWPKSWDVAFNEDHLEWINDIFESNLE